MKQETREAIGLIADIMGCHIYKFYEEYMSSIPHGIITFLQSIPDMKLLFEAAKITGKFYWHDHDISFIYKFTYAIDELLCEYFREARIKQLSHAV